MASPTRDGLLDLLRRRIVVAPMAGGPTTAGLVVAAARAGALGWLAAGYKTPGAMATEITAVRAATAEPFGVNVFVPGRPHPDAAALARYLDSLGPGRGDATWDDDGFDGKIAALLADPPAFTQLPPLSQDPSTSRRRPVCPSRRRGITRAAAR